MNVPMRIAIALFCVATFTGCSKDTVDSGEPEQPWNGEDYMDKSIRPGDDFFLYANGCWLARNPIPDGKRVWGLMEQHEVEQDRKLLQLLQTTGDPVVTLCSRLSKDFVRSTDYGFRSLQPLLAEIGSVGTREGLIAMVARLIREGYSPFIEIKPGVSMDNDRVFVPQLNVTQPKYDNYDLYEDEDFAASYTRTLAISLQYIDRYNDDGDEDDGGDEGGESGDDESPFGEPDPGLLRKAQNAFGIQQNLVSCADPDTYRFRYMIRPEVLSRLTELDATKAPSSITDLLGLCGIHMSCQLATGSVFQVFDLILNGDIELLKDYMYMHVIEKNIGNCSYLSLKIWLDMENRFELDDKRREAYTKGDNEGRLYDARQDIKAYAPDYLSRLYAEAYANASEKTRLTEMASKLRATFRERIEQNAWLGSGTKARAIEKLDAMTFCISYPDQWPEMAMPELSGESYCAAVSGLRRYAYASKLGLFGLPLADNAWKGLLLMSPLYTYNCFYWPGLNSLIIETTFSMPPVFDARYPDAQAYGSLGVVVGHEMTHGFDSNGALFDKTGAFASWWELADEQAFMEKQRQMIDWFDRFEILPGVFKDGTRTLTENIADLGGVNIAYDAFGRTLDARGMSAEDRRLEKQRFFLSYGQLWCGTETADFTRMRLQKDNHSVGKFRILGIVPMMDEWYDLFGVEKDDKMYVEPEKRIYIW